MRDLPLYVITQPEEKNSFWAQLINRGIREAATAFHDTLCAVDPDDLSYDLKDMHALVVGNNAAWVERSAISLMRRGAFPIIVNASVLPVNGLRCSGVTFELEEIIMRCIRLLSESGRRRVALLGVNPDSLADRVKADLFAKVSVDLRPEDIIWSAGRLEDCVSEFVKSFRNSDHDAVICSNDTVAIRLLGMLPEGVVPEKLFVIGMGSSYIGANICGGITSVMFDYREMGRMSVKLWHDLIRMDSGCHMTLSLPCRLIVRRTAELPDKPSEPEIRSSELPSRDYFSGDEVQNIIRVETMLQSCDSFDRELIFGISRGETCDYIAERLFFSGRTVRYRLSKIIKEYGFENRAALEKSVRAALGEKETIW